LRGTPFLPGHKLAFSQKRKPQKRRRQEVMRAREKTDAQKEGKEGQGFLIDPGERLC